MIQLFWDKVSLSCPGWPCCVAQDGFKLVILLHRPPKSWNYRHELPHPEKRCNLKYHPFVRGLIPAMTLLRGDRTFKRWGLVGGLQVIGDVSLKGTVGTQLFRLLLSLSLFYFLTMRWVVLFCHDVLSLHCPKATWTGISKIISQNKSSVFFIVIESWLTH
jgi:hypothetical protein